MYTGNGAGIRFVFLDGEKVPQAAGFYNSGAVYITPRDAFDPSQKQLLPNEDSETVSNNYLVATLMHEISHHSDHKMNPGVFAGQENVLKQLEQNFGYSRIIDRHDPADPANQTQQKWVILDNKGNMYKKVKDGWVKCDKDGLEIDKPITAKQMRAIAAVKPVSNYFTDPHEMFAEALTAYRIGGEWKDRLQKDCPELFKIAQEHDQRERAYHAGAGWAPIAGA